MMRVGLASDHGGFNLKGEIAESLRGSGYEVVDFGAHQLNPGDDYPDFIIPLARAVAAGQVTRGVAVCGSGVGASIAANKVPGARAGLIHDVFSAHQGVEDDDMNVFLFGRKGDRGRACFRTDGDFPERSFQRRPTPSAAPRKSTGVGELDNGAIRVSNQLPARSGHRDLV